MSTANRWFGFPWIPNSTLETLPRGQLQTCVLSARSRVTHRRGTPSHRLRHEQKAMFPFEQPSPSWARLTSAARPVGVPETGYCAWRVGREWGMVTERHDDVIEVNSQEQLEDVARQVDECAEVATEPSDVVMALTRPGDVTSETLLVAVMERAFAHDLVRNPNRLGDVELGTRFSSPKGDWPPAFDAVEEREKTTWAEVAKLVCEPLAKAHLHDVLLAAGIVSGRQQAIDVCDHYLAVAELEHVSSRYRVLCLARVSSLARRYSLDVELVARRRMFRLCQVAVPEGNLGVVVDCLTSLCVAPRVGQFITPSRADLAQIAGGLAAKINNEWLADELLQVRLELAVSERERNEARRDYIGVFLHLAEAVQGLVRQSWLNRAAAEAKRLGQKDLEDQAVAAMQAMSADDLGLESVWLGG